MAGDDMDRDFAIRTMLGEARNQGDAGLAGVAHVILNRAETGKYGGRTPTDVVLAPRQFEPWQTRAGELLAIPKNDPHYQRAGQIYDMVSSGEIPDITAGATHFLNKATVRDRTGGRLPAWAQGASVDIGSHSFLKPNGAVKRKTQDAAPDLSGFDDLERLSDTASGIDTLEQAAAGRATPGVTGGSVRVTLPNATKEQDGDGLDALERVASANDPAAKAESGDASAAVGAGIISGLPVIGPTVMDGVQRGLGHVRAFQSGKPYEEELDAVRKFTTGTTAEHPTAAGAGAVLGGVVGLAPIASTGAGAAALGLRGNMLARTAAGIGSGAALGAGDAAVRGEDVGRAAALGGFVGGAAPVAGKLIGAVAAPVVNRLTTAAQDTFSGATRANNALLAAVEASGQDTAALRAELTRNPNFALADLSPALREQVVGLAQGGPQAAQVQNWVAARRALQPEQLREGFDNAIGAAPDPVALRDQLVKTAKTNAKTGFDKALDGAQSINLDGLSPETLKAIEEARAAVANRLPEGAPKRGGVGRSADLAAAVRSAETGARGPVDAAAPSVGASVFTPSGREVGVRYRLVEADAPTASHGPDMRPNPAFPADLQPRDRTRAASEAQVRRMAGELQPGRLGASSSAAEGAPILGPDGVVESGNGRVLAIRQAYAAHPERAAEYREWLKGQGYEAGNLRRPMLVRERVSELSPDERVRFTQEANAGPGLAASATERAATDAGRLSPDALGLYQGGDVASAANRPFVREFLRTVADKGEEGAFAARDGALSMEGARRVRNALLHAGYGDSGVVSALAESGDEGLRAFGNVLGGASGKMAQLRAGIAARAIDRGADLTGPVVEAARFVQAARNRGAPLHEAAAQQDAFSRLSPEADAILRQGYGADLRGRLAGGQLTEFLNRAADEALQQTSGARLFGAPLSSGEILGRGKPLSGAAHAADAPAVGMPEASSQGAEQQTRSTILGDKPPPKPMSADEAHLVQQELRARATDLGKSATGSDRIAARQFSDIRDRLVDRIDTATGGRFRPAQKQFADDISVREAFDNGMQALDRVRNGAKGLEGRPEVLKREFSDMRPAERDAYRQGVRTQIAATMDAARNPARAGEAVTDAGFNRQKLAIIFGDEEAGSIMRAVEDSRRIADTNNRVFAGSDTAQRTAARESVRVRGESAPASGLELPAMAGVLGGPGAAAASLAAKGGNRLIGAAGRRSDLTRNRLLADTLTAEGPAGAAELDRLDAFLAQRRALPAARRDAISRNAPLNLLIRAGGQRAYSP